jgi:DNA-directed RNA polymerase subunit beta
MARNLPTNHRAAHRRKSYARIADVIPIPDLIKTQLESFEWFQSEGLRELFDEISPIVSFNKALELHFPGYNEELNAEFGLDYRFAEPTYTEDECRDRDATYAAPLYVKVLLYNRETDQPIVQEVYMGDFPVMTANATFLINGAERVVVSQLIRSPGAYFTTEEDRATGRQLCMAKLIPDRGAWLEFDTSRRDLVSVKVDRKRKIPVTVLLRALGAVSDGIDDVDIREGADEELLELFEGVDNIPDHPYIQTTLEHDTTKTAAEALSEFYRKMRPGDPATFDNAKSYLEALLFSRAVTTWARWAATRSTASCSSTCRSATAPDQEGLDSPGGAHHPGETRGGGCRRHRSPGQPPRQDGGRVDPEPVAGGLSAYGARGPRTDEHSRPRSALADLAHQRAPRGGGDPRVLWRQPAFAVHDPDQPAGRADPQADALRSGPRRPEARPRRL